MVGRTETVETDDKIWSPWFTKEQREGKCQTSNKNP